MFFFIIDDFGAVTSPNPVDLSKEKALIQLGVKPDIAYGLSHTGKGYQLVAKTSWLKFAINNERLRKRGLIFLSDQYAKVHVEI